MSSWLSDGLRTLESYFDADDDADAKQEAAAVRSASGAAKRKHPAPDENDAGANQLHPPKQQAPPIRTSKRSRKPPRRADEQDAPPDLSPKFRARLEELKRYMAKHNHMNIPRSDHRRKGLCAWVTAQRQSRATMTQAEKDALDSIGFDWKGPDEERNPFFWERIDELTAYKEKHGHITMKKNANKRLYDFCCNQKMRYNHFPARYGCNRAMTLEEKAALDGLGFEVWTRKPDKCKSSGKK